MAKQDAEIHQPHKLIGKDYTTPDLLAKVTGKAKYAEDFRADGMLFCKLLLSPLPHARVRGIDTRAALAMPGVKAILTMEDLPAPAAYITDDGQTVQPNPKAERGLTNEPLYQGEPILAVAAVDELSAAEAIERIHIDFERLPFAVDPLATLRPGGANARQEGNVWVRPAPPPPTPGARPQAARSPKSMNSNGPKPTSPTPSKAVSPWAKPPMNGVSATLKQVSRKPPLSSTKRS